MRLLAAPDKFRGTMTAPQVAHAIGEAAWEAGWDCIEVPVSDGGEGLLDAFGGPNRSTEVHGPLGERVDAPWRLSRGVAIIESAAACGIDRVGGAAGNEPLRADTTGVGELLLAAVHAGAKRIVVGLGGSATTDGGMGAVNAIAEPARLGGVEIVAACDVDIPFGAAAQRFAPQKGATTAQVRLLTRRLEATAAHYRDTFGRDVTGLAFGGAAGGLAGGLAALGARLESGFDVVAEEHNLAARVSQVDLVITGEGVVDQASYEGKVVGGLVAFAQAAKRPSFVVCGDADEAVMLRARTVSLTQHFGAARAWDDTHACVRGAVAAFLAQWD